MSAPAQTATKRETKEWKDAFYQTKKDKDAKRDRFSNHLFRIPEKDYIPKEDEVFSKCENLYEILEENNEIIAAVINTQSESERNTIIVSMIEEMNGMQYHLFRDKALSKNVEKEYYNSRKYAITGQKVPT